MLQRFELYRFVWEGNGFVLNSRNYCCLTIKLASRLEAETPTIAKLNRRNA